MDMLIVVPPSPSSLQSGDGGPSSADLIDALPLKKRLRAKTGGATFAH